MSKFYSRTTNGFYDGKINANIPPDGVAVTDTAYAALFAAQASGQVIQSDVNGNPEAVNPPAPTSAQAHAALQASAQAALDKSDTTIIRCYSAGVATPAAWETYRAELRAIVNGSDTTSTTLPATPTFPANA